MASLNGVEIKNLIKRVGTEGEYFSGKIVYNGKVLGDWTQDSWGGPDNYTFDGKELEVPVKEHFNKIADEVIIPSIGIKTRDLYCRDGEFDLEGFLEAFFNDIVNLTLAENIFKSKGRKKIQFADFPTYFPNVFGSVEDFNIVEG